VIVDNSKLEAVKAWPRPINLKQWRGFLGLFGFYQRFVKGYAHVAASWLIYLKRMHLSGMGAATTDFLQVKDVLTTPSVLFIPYFSEWFILETDASGFGVGAVLSQGTHPADIRISQI